MNYLLVTEQASNHLRMYRQQSDGRLEQQQVLDIPGGPASLVVSPNQKLVYVATRDEPGMNTYAIGPACALTFVARLVLPSDPCFTNTDRTGRWLLTSYFAEGSVRIVPIGDDGLPSVEGMHYTQTYIGAHCVHTTEDNRYLFVPHVGSNKIMQFRFDETTGSITANDPAEVEPFGWHTPRHMVFHPNKPIMYTSNEKGSSITAWALDRDQGVLRELQTLSTLPAGWQGENTCAQIHIRPDGRFVYVSNRGHDSIARFAINPDSGQLRLAGLTKTEAIPRVFDIEPSGQFMYVAGRDTGWLVAYALDETRGEPIEIARFPIGQRAMWVQALSLSS